MSLDARHESIGTKHEFNEYTTSELVSVLTHAETSRRQMDRFVESVTAELTRRGTTQDRIVSLNLGRRIGGTQLASRLSRRRKQPGPELASTRSRWIG
jgi:hypothetical protein